MSMWSRLKLAVLSATVAVTVLSLSGCLSLNGLMGRRILQLVAIDNLID